MTLTKAKRKFKAGDKVMFVGFKNTDVDDPSTNTKIGQIMTIVHVDDYIYPYETTWNGQTGLFREDEIELATKLAKILR